MIRAGFNHYNHANFSWGGLCSREATPAKKFRPKRLCLGSSFGGLIGLTRTRALKGAKALFLNPVRIERAQLKGLPEGKIRRTLPRGQRE